MRIAVRIATLCLALAMLFGAQAQTAFPVEAFLEDYDQLWMELEENYPFLPIVEENGCDLAALKAENRALIETRVRDLEGFAAVLRDTTARMGALAHLGLIGPESYASYVQLVEDGAFADGSPEIALVQDAQTQASYALLGAGAEATQRTLPEVETAYYPELRAAYFHFKSFDHSLIARDGDVISEFLAAHPDAEHVIIDITGNTGGSDGYWSDVIVSAFGEAVQWQTASFLKWSPLNEEYLQGEEILPLEALPAEFELPDFVDELGFTHFHVDTFAFSGTEAAAGASVKRWVLIDGAVFSAADGFAAFCKGSGWATLVGSAAMGDGADAFRPFVVRLDNTGLLLRFSTSAAANADGSLNILNGTKPDVLCKLRETPLQACLRTIARG